MYSLKLINHVQQHNLSRRQKIASKHATTKSTAYKDVDIPLELCCALMENLNSFFDDERFHLIKSESPTPFDLPRYDPYQILFSQEDGGIFKRKTLEETRRETRRGRGREMYNFCTLEWNGRESLLWVKCWTSKPLFLFYST